jgi:superfamily II DNA or RNA helicase
MSLTTFVNDRPIQTKAFNKITELLQTYDECLVKMFCGTGKSRVIKRIILELKHPLSVVVFPSLALIRQFTKDYLGNVRNIGLLNVSSEELAHITSTTDPAQIHHFLHNPNTKHQQKIICVTYQSLDVLLSSIGDTKIGIACFDEAHRTTSPEAKELVYGDEYRTKYEKQVFFTATPVNANGITMFDRERNEMGTYGDCGPLACEYTYLQGLRDGILSLFELRIDLYTQDTLGNMYESIARAILTTGNTRVLTFHADAAAESDSETSVLRFVDKAKFVEAFRAVCAKEFPDKVGVFADERITFRAITATTKDKDAILSAFETCSDTEIYIVASCRTIGEGVDTKKANMCVFVDPKSSPKDIIQNIGRICRKVAGVERQPATVLIPVCISWDKYREAGDDPEVQDKLIREQLNDRENGDYNAIMNVCAALKQEDLELYELCLKYPSNFTESERKHALEEQGFRVLEEEDDDIGEGDDDDRDDREPNVLYEYDIDELVENGERVEIHTSNTEQPIIYRGFDDENGEEDADGGEDTDEDERHIQRFYKVEEENDDGEMETRYHRIVSMEGREEESDNKRLKPPKPTNRPRMNIHTNDEIKLLWKMGDVAIGEQFGSGVLECKVERLDAIENWKTTLIECASYIDLHSKAPLQTSRLGRWLGNQKENAKHNMRILKKEEIRHLWNEFELQYHSYITPCGKFERSLDEVRRFIDVNNRRPNKHSADENEAKLGRWICTTVQNFKNKQQIMSDDKFRKLWSGFITDPTYSRHFPSDTVEAWFTNFEELKKYIKDYHKPPSGKSKDHKTKKLGIWYLTQKRNYDREESLSPGECMKNPDIRKAWKDFTEDPTYSQYLIGKADADEEDWSRNCQKLAKYAIEHKKMPSAKDQSSEIKSLGVWCAKQRASFRGGKMISEKTGKPLPSSSQRISDLEKIPGWYWSGPEANINELINFQKTFQRLPKQHSGNEYEQKMTNIITGFRREYRKDNLDDKWIKKLEEIPGWFWHKNEKKTQPTQTNSPLPPPPPPPSPPPTKPKPKPRLVIKKSHLIPNPSASLECSAPETNPISNPSNPKCVITDSPYKLTGRAWSTQKSTTTHEKLRSNPAEWHAYHAARDISFQGYTDQSQIPRNRIIAHLANKRKHRLRILDLGCGRNNIAQHYADADKDHKFVIQGYDHVVDEGSTARVGNIADLAAQEDDESADICIYSQSLMGSDWREYLAEGHRILRYNGEFIISEHIKMLDDVRAELGRLGCKIESEAADDAGAGAVEASDADDKVAKWFVLVARKV